ncbi:hypothetical protein PGR6_43460 [Pseudomonas sp. GR 6-02]|nr:hypothetical protein PGR6_43460 [Pseudomonas sp. GR 6-02]
MILKARKEYRFEKLMQMIVVHIYTSENAFQALAYGLLKTM